MNNNVVSLNSYRKARPVAKYEASILLMDRMELLEEMVRFQEERSRNGHLTREMILRGMALFKTLESVSETQELRMLCRSYYRYLESCLVHGEYRK